jgi:hypothetical protein
MDTIIRRASAADLDALVPLFDAYRVFYAQPSDPVRARDFLAERFANGESAVLIAERGPSTVGFTQLYPIFSSVRTSRTWLLNDLFVVEGARRGGVARALLDKEMPGFGEMFRVLSFEEIGTSTMQSRAFAGLSNNTFVFCLPGSTSACRTAWEKLIRAQLDATTRPCNLAGLMPRLREM